MGTKASTIKKGDKFWCLEKHLGKPMLGSVVCLTPHPGKLVGLQFEEQVPTNVAHLDLDGRGKRGFCIWAHPDSLLTEAEAAEEKEEKEKKEKKVKKSSVPDEIDELVLVAPKEAK